MATKKLLSDMVQFAPYYDVLSTTSNTVTMKAGKTLTQMFNIKGSIVEDIDNADQGLLVSQKLVMAYVATNVQSEASLISAPLIFLLKFTDNTSLTYGTIERPVMLAKATKKTNEISLEYMRLTSTAEL